MSTRRVILTAGPAQTLNRHYNRYTVLAIVRLDALQSKQQMSATDADTDREERLKSALWYSIGQYVDEECLSSNVNATPQFIGALTELVYTQIANTARDLETFSAHAGRRVITPDDVMLLTRRNEKLEEYLQMELTALRSAEGRRSDGQPKAVGAPVASKKRGRPSGTGTGKGKKKAQEKSVK